MLGLALAVAYVTHAYGSGSDNLAHHHHHHQWALNVPIVPTSVQNLT
jgi:hypothetical protein